MACLTFTLNSTPVLIHHATRVLRCTARKPPRGWSKPYSKHSMTPHEQQLILSALQTTLFIEIYK